MMAYITGMQPTAHGPQSGPPGQSMWPSTMAGQKNFFLKSIYLAICTVYNTRVVFSIL